MAQYLRRHRAPQQAGPEHVPTRGQGNEIYLLVASDPRDDTGGIAFEQQAPDRNPLKLLPPQLVQIFLGPLDGTCP
jgi:hypothetical protein